MIKQLGGDIRIESSKNHGTVAVLDFIGQCISSTDSNFIQQVLKHNELLGNRSNEYEIIKLTVGSDQFVTCLNNKVEIDCF